MRGITFIDTEVSEDNQIVDFGGINVNGEFIHSSILQNFQSFIADSDFLCGHNIFHFDLVFLRTVVSKNISVLYDDRRIIDTLYWSPLLFPQRPYHALIKDDKLQVDELNNPLNDAKKARDLFFDEVETFKNLPDKLKEIYYLLLKDKKEFSGLFSYLNYESRNLNIILIVKELFAGLICENVDLQRLINENPVELAYSLSLIHVNDDYSIIPPWIIKQYAKVDIILHKLRGTPCITGCNYCKEELNANKGLKRFFGYDAYRDFDGVPLQESAVKAAIANKSILAIFPTGGGKSITFQVPALMAGRNTKGLTVVISPLQSLMKDQVDNLERNGITDAVTINGLLDPIERAEAINRVRNGDATILYISPESLRSKTIENLLLGRKIIRFVIDEAHCFSAWGQDFRVDYLYIADFMKKLYQSKNLEEMIPVSCFTATAKQNVVDDIKMYFKDNLNLELELFTASASRKNLSYQVIEKQESEKYETIRRLLEYKKCPTIIYVSRTARATKLAESLNQDGYYAKAYHGKMEKKEKSDNQDAFIRGEIDIMVATSAFGMGVDKKDVGMVIHYDISDSLENYVQEAGRAGRDQTIQAECFVLFNDEDLNKHFLLLNQTKISVQEIQQIWKAIKEVTRTRKRMSSSALEIARKAGWDDNVKEIETRVKTAIAALEEAGYIKRGQNMPRIFADSIMARTVIEARERIERSRQFTDSEKEEAVRIIQKLISNRSKNLEKDQKAESRVDYLADDLGLDKSQVIHIIQKLREIKILADAKDLSVFMDEKGSIAKNMMILNSYYKVEEFLWSKIREEQTVLNIKEQNELAQEEGIKKITPDMIKTIINYWVIKGLITKETSQYNKNLVRVNFAYKKEEVFQIIQKRYDIARINLEYFESLNVNNDTTVHFSVLELVNNFNFEMQLLQQTASSNELEDSLLYLSKIGAIKIEGGFVVSYNALSIERIEHDNKIRYKLEDYKKLKQYYEQKTQMIHIVGEYAKKLMNDYQSALIFVEDYFQLEYSSFLQKYFKGSKGNEIQKNITPKKFQELFGELSPAQLQIINDKHSQYIVVGAGPGSGKTRILVHKLASLLLMEDIKHEQLLMLTFSRAATTEFKKRLLKLIGNAAHYVEIKTFHSYCFDLLGKVGNIEKSIDVIEETYKQIINGDVEVSRITKTVLVIDEAQDIELNEFRLIQALIDKNDDMRVIAVGDDDQNIYSFRGSDSKYMQEFLKRNNAKFYELVENYRSKSNIVTFTNSYVIKIKNRLKLTPIMPVQADNGQIKIIQYQSRNIVIPLVNTMLRDGILSSTCVLTATNEEALQLIAQLQMNGIKAKLLQSNESYLLYNLVEVRYFINELDLKPDTYLILDEVWDKAKQKLRLKYRNSKNLFICEQLVREFEETNNKYKYVSDWMSYVYESQEEDFYHNNRNSIIVGTIHKSKGWEYDHVIIMLKDISIQSDEMKRQLYVGMTRAKKSLTIHYNGDYLYNIANYSYYGQIDNLEYQKDNIKYDESDIIRIQLGYRDVYLSDFKYRQKQIENLISGDLLLVKEEGCFIQNGNNVLYFSSKFKSDISKHRMKGYQITTAKVNYILYWKGENEDKELLILLPEIELRRI